MRRLLRTVFVALLAAALLAVPARVAVADQVDDGWLDWGIRSSFLEYVTGPIAQGDWELTDDATAREANRFRFHSGSGRYRPGSGEYRASYAGSVRFLGHQREDGGYELDLTIANPTVEIADGDGALYADVTNAAGHHEQVRFAELGIADVDVDGAGIVTASGVAATLTARGAEAFAGYYTEGEQLDPIDFTGELVPESEPSPEPEPTTSPEPSATPTTPAIPTPAPPSGMVSPAPAARTEPAGGSSSAVLPIALGLAAAAAAVGGVLMWRRRTSAAPPDDSDQE